jgi:hypothetical protein
MKKIFMSIVLLLFIAAVSTAWMIKSDDQAEINSIKKTIVEAYVDGIFLKGDAELIKKGWHPDCDIVYLKDGKVNKLQAKFWVDRMTKDPKPLDPNVTYKFSDVKVTGYAGIAVVEILTSGRHLYTDYMNLYKFTDGWKIVTKTYYTYPQN